MRVFLDVDGVLLAGDRLAIRGLAVPTEEALERLRQKLPDSVFADLGDEPEQ